MSIVFHKGQRYLLTANGMVPVLRGGRVAPVTLTPKQELALEKAEDKAEIKAEKKKDDDIAAEFARMFSALQKMK